MDRLSGGISISTALDPHFKPSLPQCSPTPNSQRRSSRGVETLTPHRRRRARVSPQRSSIPRNHRSFIAIVAGASPDLDACSPLGFRGRSFLMNKLGFPGLKGLDHLRSFAGSAKGGQMAPRPSESVSFGSFANLKLTAEKLVKEQASVKTDLEMAHTKLKKAMEQIHVLEAKLQEAVNENAKLKVKQTEDAKLWKGLDSKLSSTKTLSDQLTETLQHLACQARAAEDEKKFFEKKLAENSKAFDDLYSKLNDLSMQLESADNTIRIGKQELLELRHEKEGLEKIFRDECSANENAIKGKDAVIKQLEDAAEENSAHLQTLDTQLQRMQQELILKEEVCKCLRATQETLENEKSTLQCSNQEFAQKLDLSCQRTKELEDLVSLLTEKVTELDKESATISDQLVKLFSSFKTCCELAQQEKDLVTSSAHGKYDQLQKQALHISSEKDALNIEIKELKNKILELQKAQEVVMVQHVEECRLAEDKIRRLECEAEALVSKKNESEKLLSEIELEVKHLTESASKTEIQMQELLQKITRSESENTDLQDKMQTMLLEKAEEIETLQNEIEKSNKHRDLLENQISELRNALEEKEQLHLSFVEREKQLEAQRSEIQELLAASESKLTEARKQYDLMLEGKQIELSKHLKELSQRNDQAINDIRKKYEFEKVEIANLEKEKADKLVKEMERKCDEKILENKEEAQQYLMRVKGEHGAMLSRIQQDNDLRESSLQAHHKDELKRIQLHAEIELREKVSSLRKEHEIQIKSLKMEHEDGCRRLQEELELQKSKEDKQRALLQLQWKVMSENQQHDQEVNSKKEYSVSSIKKRDPYNGKEHKLAAKSPGNKKDVNLPGYVRTPISNIMKKADNRNPGSTVSIPKHSKRVTRNEYEVEILNGGRITKRRKTKSTAVFKEPKAQEPLRTRTPAARKTPNASKDATKVKKAIGGPHPDPANIGDLFSEGSLNPYADDPYAFD